MKSKIKVLVMSITLIMLVLLIATSASACTGVYVGKDVSSDGSIILARTVDSSSPFNITTCQVYPRIENVPGRVIESSDGFTWELPATTYKYTGIPHIPANGAGSTNWDAGVTNEYGLIVTATVTGDTPKSVLQTDPFVETGIGEENIAQILGQSCKTAKEAIQLLASIIDEKGSSEPNIVMVADQDEAWYMEIYTGHQYAAVKMPSDKVAVYGNEFMLETLDEFDDKIVSPNLVSHAEANGLAKYSGDSLNLLDTYAGGDAYRRDFSHQRTWYGHKLFSPSTIGDYETHASYPLFYTPDKKISVKDVMDVLRSRYEDTSYDASTGKYRTIAVENCTNAHILQSFDSLPQEMSAICWVTLSETSYAPFVPFSNMVTAHDSHYTYASDSYNRDDYGAYSQFKRLNSLSVSRDRAVYGSGIRNYWEETENYYLTVLPDILKTAAELNSQSPEKAEKYLTDAAISFESDAYFDAGRLFDDLMLYMSETFNSINPLNDDTRKIEDNPRTIDPFESSFDVARFGKQLGYTVSTDTSGTVTLEKDGTKISVSPSDGVRGSTGKLSINGETSEINAYSDDGKVYLPLSCLGVLKDNSTYRYVSEDTDTSIPATSSPFPVLGILTGLGIACVLVTRKH